MTARAAAALAAAAFVALTNAGCGEERGPGGRAASTSPTPVAAGATTIANAVAVVDVSLSDYALTPANPRVARHGVVAFVATNDGLKTHVLAVDGPAGEVATRPLRPGEQEAIPVRLPPGTYKWLCPLDDHERRGMVGRIRVAE